MKNEVVDSKKYADHNNTSITERLRRSKRQIIQLWELRVKQEIPLESKHQNQRLIDDISGLLNILEKLLDESPLPNLQQIAHRVHTLKIHGQKREEQNYNIGEMLLEYQILRQIIIEELEKSGSLPQATRQIIYSTLNEASRQAAEQFIHIQSSKHMIPRWIEGDSYTPLRYLISFLIIAASTLIQWLIWPLVDPAPYLLFYPAIIIASLVANGWLALFLSAITIQYFFIQPTLNFGLTWPSDHLRQGIFILSGALIVALTNTLKSISKKSQNEKMRSLSFANQQNALAELSRIAVSTDNLLILLNAATEKVAQILNAKYAKILEFMPIENILLLKSCSGCEKSDFNNKEISISDASHASYTLRTQAPVVVSDYRKDRRFKQPAHFHGSDIISGIGVPIVGTEHPYGVLILHCDKIRKFTGDEQIFVASVADILAISIERFESAEKLKIAKDEAERASGTKSQFLANMSHEIRTPMNAILGFSELLLNRQLSDEEELNYLARIRSNGSMLLRLIDDILDLSKVEAGKLQVDKIKFLLTDALLDVVDGLKSLADKKNLYLKIELLNSIPMCINSDPLRLRQILTNLVGNAIKFTEIGGITIKLKYYTHPTIPHKGSLILDVEDTGLGISTQDQEKLFQPFSQADSSVSRKFGGTGLGLILSKKLAQALDGQLILKSSQLNKGSCFRLTLNLQDVNDTQLLSHKDLPLQKRHFQNDSEHQNSDPRLTGTKILVAEDSPDNQTLMQLILKTEGAEVDIAENGYAVLSAIDKKDYDVILMDVQMPELDGLETTRRLRHQGFLKPIFALTAHALPEEITRSIQAGCDLHLAKPINRADLINSIKLFAEQFSYNSGR